MVVRVTALIGPGPASQAALTVTVLPSRAQGVPVLRLVGEIDLATVGLLREYLYQHALGGARGVVLDCTEVSFLAACGVGLLVEIAHQARAKAVTLRLAAPSQAVLRVLEITGVDGLVPRVATVAEAVVQCST